MAYTSFFRDPDALDAIRRIVIPTMSHRRGLWVWDAGCATGEEPYTLAIIFASKIGPFTFNNLDILATDHEESNFPQFEDHIRAALYSRKDIFWVPEVLREIYFVPTSDPEFFCVIPEIRKKVRFIRHDLLSFQPPEKEKSLIVCKNVLMHFSPLEQLRVLEMFWDSLLPDGFLVLDGTQIMPDAFCKRFLRIEPNLPLWQKMVPSKCA